jgi:hypothetical protein
MVTNLVNLTPFELVILRPDGSKPLVLPRGTGPLPHVYTRQLAIYQLHGVTVSRELADSVRDVPDPRYGTTYVVTRQVAQALRDRHDLLCFGERVTSSKGVLVLRGLTEP